MVKTGKWVMSIRWQMCGVEVLFDTNIGKWLSLLGNTLTAFAGETDIANLDSVADMTEKEPVKEPVGSVDEVDHHPSSSRKSRKRNIEREMWEQSRKVNELRCVKYSILYVYCVLGDTKVVKLNVFFFL